MNQSMNEGVHRCINIRQSGSRVCRSAVLVMLKAMPRTSSPISTRHIPRSVLLPLFEEQRKERMSQTAFPGPTCLVTAWVGRYCKLGMFIF